MAAHILHNKSCLSSESSISLSYLGVYVSRDDNLITPVQVYAPHRGVQQSAQQPWALALYYCASLVIKRLTFQDSVNAMIPDDLLSLVRGVSRLGE